MKDVDKSLVSAVLSKVSLTTLLAPTAKVPPISDNDRQVTDKSFALQVMAALPIFLIVKVCSLLSSPKFKIVGVMLN